ncbi:MAG TPA: glycosyltransferase family 1 protein [Bryobacteraceae bacterium]|nr:glycosyltransferase family 1 protein [Bryobacteraceae bacterium]
MRICIDATSLLLRSAGVKNYVYHWMRSLQREAKEHDITAFPALGEVGELNHEGSVLSLWRTIPRIALLHFANIRHNPSMDLLMRKVDVFHASNQVRNPPRRTLLTGTLYDMTCLLMPQNHTAANVRAEQNFADQVLRRAHGLISISEHTKSDAVRLLGLDPNRIRVIYPGVPERFFDVPGTEVRRVAKQYRFSKPYILFVGTIEPRKNIDLLLDAYAQLPRDTREEFELVVAGPAGWAAVATVERLKQVRYLGYVPERDLPGITAGAAVFVYPSLYEGFGFPVAQAMAAGVPVITSNVSSLPEVAGESAVLVDPRSVSDLKTALGSLLGSAEVRAKLGAQGAVKAREYTWHVSARKSAVFFNELG